MLRQRNGSFLRPKHIAEAHTPTLRQRRATVKAAAQSSTSPEYEALRGIQVVSAATGFAADLLSLWQPSQYTTVVIPFLTHFADLSSWEYAQKLKQKVLQPLQAQGVQVITVGLGSAENAARFASTVGYPIEQLYADPTGACYKALDFSPGFAPEAQVNSYLKLLPMLAGIGSPGTLQEVIRGYIGDRSSGPVFEASSPFDVLGTGYQRPFELATLRLFNMVGILPKWAELSPEDTRLLTQQGGTLAFKGTNLIFKHVDSGILGQLKDTDALLAAVAAAANRRAEPALQLQEAPRVD